MMLKRFSRKSQIAGFLALMIAFIGSPVVVAQTVGLVSHGGTLRLVEVSAGGMTEIDSFSFDEAEAGIFSIHTIFDLQMSPVNGEVYISSFNPCWSGDIGCWGNARIDRFLVTTTSIEHLGPAFKFDPDTAAAGGAPDCATDDFGYDDQRGACAPSDFTFSPDGSRVYVDEDNDDFVEIFEVLADGNLAFIQRAVDARTFAHGFEISNDGQYLYHSERVFRIDGDDLTEVNNGQIGPQQLLLDNGLLSALAGGELRIYDLVDPETPNELGRAVFGDNALDFATLDGNLFVVTGRSMVALAEWDGTNFTVLDELEVPDFDLLEGGTRRASVRGVDVFEQNGTLYAVAAMFSPGNDETYDLNPAFIRGYRIDNDGLTEIWSEQVSGQARSVMLAGGSQRISGQSLGSITFPLGTPPVAPLAVPVNSAWGLLALMLLLAFVGLRFLPRGQARA